MNDSERLKKRQAELSAKIEALRDQLGAAMLAGKDTSRLIGDLAKLEAESNAIPAALAMAARQAEEQAGTARAARDAENEAAAQAKRAELDRIDQQAVEDLARLVGTFQKMSAIQMGLIGLHKSAASMIHTDLMARCAQEMDRLQRAYPERFGMPPKPTADQLRRREAEESVQQARDQLKRLQDARKAHEFQVSDLQMENAAYTLAQAEKRLAELA